MPDGLLIEGCDLHNVYGANLGRKRGWNDGTCRCSVEIHGEYIFWLLIKRFGSLTRGAQRNSTVRRTQNFDIDKITSDT